MGESVRIVVIDFYMNPPIQGLDVTYSEFRGSTINQVPILRCFGSTKTGEKICIHIHGVFPYLYIPYDGTGNPDQLMYQIAASIDKAVNIALNQGSSSTQHVYKITLVSGIPMYGYHSKKHQFFKIFLYNPMLLSTVTNLLLNRSILDKLFQPHEAHLNFTLQFMIDYNLHGMSNMNISELKFRTDPDKPITDINKELLPESIERITVCELEADINAENILNRQEILDGNLGINPGIAALWEDEKQRRRNKNESSQLGPFLELKNMKNPPTNTHVIFQQALAERLAVSSTDKNEPKESLDISVYPAETPNDINLQNASLIDIHTPSSIELSLDDTINMSSSQSLDYTLTQSNLNVTMDEDANNFLQLLEDLAGEKDNKKVNEEDGILSQITNEDEQNGDFNEDFLDLSMPLAAVTTPQKIITNADSDRSDDDRDYLDTTLIPQVDGQTNLNEMQFNGPITRSRWKKSMEARKKISDNSCSDNKTEILNCPVTQRCGKSMPSLDIDILPPVAPTRVKEPLNKFNLISVDTLHRNESLSKIDPLDLPKSLPRPQKSKRTRRKPEEIIERHLWLIRYRINRINLKSKIKKIGNLIFKHDRLIGSSLGKSRSPKFNIVPGRKWFLESHQKDDTNDSIISRILIQTHNYVYPTLHLLFKPTKEKQFLYYYGGKSTPKITEIPLNISEVECQKMICNTCKSRTSKYHENIELKRQEIKTLQNQFLNIKVKPFKTKINRKNCSSKNDNSVISGTCNDLSSSLKDMSHFSTPSDLEQPVAHINFKKQQICDFEKMLRDEVQKANNTLQKHIQHLDDFDVYRISKKIKKESPSEMKSKFIDNVRCDKNLNTHLNQVQKSDVVSQKFNISQELPMNNITVFEDNHSGNNNHWQIFNTLKKCNPTTAQNELNNKNYQKLKAFLTCLKKKNATEITKGIKLDQPDIVSRSYGISKTNSMGSWSEASDISHENNCLHTYEVNSNIPKFVNSENSPTAFSLDVYDTYDNHDRNTSTPSTDSGYVSQSTTVSELPSSTDHEYSLSSDPNSIFMNSHVRTNNSFKSPTSSRINIISDITLQEPLHVQLLHSSASCGGSHRSSLYKGAEADNLHWDLVHTHSDISKTIKKIHRGSTPNMYINCDGAVDSSSEDDEIIKKKTRKHAKRKSGSARYSPLQISVTKSPRVQRIPLEEGLAENTVGISGDQTDSNEAFSNITLKTTSSKSDVSYKRKLNFEGGTPLNSTLLEEHISCAYSPRISSTTRCLTTSNINEEKNRDEIADKESYQNSVRSESSDASNSQHLDTTYSDSDLFSDDENINKSFFKNYRVSAKYDQETKYNAKEGCSTVFSANSIVDNTSLSQNKASNPILSDNTSSDITPYQHTQSFERNAHNILNKATNQSVVGSLSSGSGSSYLKPYQRTHKDALQKKPTNLVNGKVLKPSFNAPTRLEVEDSLDELKIPQIKFKEPFYSNVDDYTGPVEIGHRLLRIPSKTSCHCPEFESISDSLNKYRKHFTENTSNLIWNSNNLMNLKLSHCSNRNIIIRPLKKPPSVQMVQLWLNDNSVPKTTPDVKTSRPKIFIPNSPGHGEDDLELSLSLTPCTPMSPQSSLVQSNEPSTPKSSVNSQISSPVIDPTKKNSKKKKGNNVERLVLRDSLLLSNEPNRSCEITGMSQHDTFGFNKTVQNLQAARAVLEYQYLTTMVMELHIRTRGDFKPDPEYDPICAIFYSILNDVPENFEKKSKAKGAVILNVLPTSVGNPDQNFCDGIGIDCDITYAETEGDVINNFLSIIKYWDPDIFAGYEVQMLSWGYLIERAFVLSINIIPLLGRSSINKYGYKQKNTNYDLETAITGRIILDVWRIMRHEIALQSYTFESIVYHILHRRVPMFAFKDFTFWWYHRTNLYRHRVVTYYLLRVETVLELFHKLDFLNRTSELARLFGILFYEVLSRGTQFRVESMMLRLAKPLNYVPVSPSTQQRARMKAPEYIALVMEPESKLYNDPVIVLDFQSLYPSIIIAYNYCFTTCVGRVNHLGTNSPYEFGATQLKVSRNVIEKLSKRDLLNFSPCGVAFVKQKVRRGILPRMLTEILDTRLMVKNSMKENKGDGNLQKVLHNRQLGLKLIANVTFGYTAANFSGRMCCVEVGDSVVSKARETLQRAIAMVENTPEWGARVVYGDTDSLFVMVPGRSREAAFELGKKIADAITADNPDPIKLKLEKIYQPCILQTKKRYVGYMYESPDQKEPVYDAKGIETVRRDGCPAVTKMLKKCITLLFETKDVSQIKKYILRQFNKIQAGRASIQDLTFAKEYRGASGYKPGACVPALELARKWKAVDRRSEPRSGERVPYIIVNGPPGLPLIRLVRSPKDLLCDSSLRPNSFYYITKVIIPPINRCLTLIGADLNIWFNQMPRKNTQYLPNSSPIVKSTISQYFVSKICASCLLPAQNGLCDRCCENVNVTALTLSEKLRRWEENYYNVKLICSSCTGHLNEITCVSLDCPVLYRRIQTYNDLQQSSYVRDLLDSTYNILEDNTYED